MLSARRHCSTQLPASDAAKKQTTALMPGGDSGRSVLVLSGGQWDGALCVSSEGGRTLHVALQHSRSITCVALAAPPGGAAAGGGGAAAAARVRALNDATLAWLRGDAGTPLALLGPDSPLWTRRFSSPARRPLARADDEAALEATLARLGGARMVVGHTPQMPGGVTAAAVRAVWRVDTGMCAAYGGPVEVLEILAREGAADDDGEADDAVVRVLTERGDVAASSRSV